MSHESVPGRRETIAALAFLGATILLHSYCVFHWILDSDEWQHLHVAWSWSQGQAPYRDFLDNHAPLFHILTAPLVSFLGETPAILCLMRLAMTPLYLAALAGSAFIALTLFGRRAALWTPVLLAPMPVFFFRSIEYRADALWMTFWVLAVAVLVAGRSGAFRLFIAGLLLGLAACTSLKTVLLVFALGLAANLAPPLASREGAPPGAGGRARLVMALLLGAAVPLTVLTAWFLSSGALARLVDATIRQNGLPRLGLWNDPWRQVLFLPEVLVFALVAAWAARRQRSLVLARRTAFLVLTAGILLAALHTLWPLFTTYDLLAFYPLGVPAVVGAMLAAPAAAPGSGAAPEPDHAWRFPVIAGLLLCILPMEYPPWADGVSRQQASLSQVLRLTDPGDRVLDPKGDAIFRRRPTPYVLERITLERLALGLIPERFPEDMIATGTCVAAAMTGRFPARTEAFLQENFIPLDHLWIAGRYLNSPGPDGDHSGSFDIAVPATYALVADGGTVTGTLDGRPYSGPRPLPAGRHTYQLTFRGSHAAVIWAQAIERGFSPFGGDDPGIRVPSLVRVR